jgi:exosortase/archaeosortase family protein
MGRAALIGPAAAFAVLYGLLHLAYVGLRSNRTGLALIDHVTVAPAAWLLAHLAPDSAVSADGPRLAWSGGSLGLRNGCDGFEVFILFAASALVAPLSAGRRLGLLLCGCLALWALNQGRIIALYASFRHQREWFDGVHTVWGPLVLVASATAMYVWALWRWQTPR